MKKLVCLVIVMQNYAYMDTPTQPELLTRKQLAKALNVSARTIDKWQAERLIPFVKFETGTVRFRLQSVMAVIQDKYTVQAEP